jgi:TRAP-type C4-dicarboxylate transport system permease small subunit
MDTPGSPGMLGPLGERLLLVAKVLAVAGALVFTGLVGMSIVSITGRKLWSAPVPGDVELLQMCAAFAASTFFAYCHLNRGDVKVDFFTDRLPARWIHALDAAGALMVGRAGETSMILGVPLWIGQSLMVPGFALLALAGGYMAVWHGRQAAGGAAP